MDLDHAEAVGSHAIKFALSGMNGVMPIIVRSKSKKYNWKIEAAPLSKIANLEKKLPTNFISSNKMNVTNKALDYLRPLIQGETATPYKNGIPDLKDFKLIKVKKKLSKWEI